MDKRRQWHYAGNVRHSAAVHMADRTGMIGAPGRLAPDAGGQPA